MSNSEFYYDLDEDIISYINNIENEFGFAINLKYIFQANTKQKTMIKIIKLPDHYQHLLKADILVSINELYYNSFDEDIREILMMQELDKIEINLVKGTIKIGQPSLKTSLGIVKRFTYEKVEKAIEVEKLFEEQQKEKEKEQQSQNKDKKNKYK